MGRKLLIIIGLAVAICACYVYIARPVLILPTVTVPMSDDSTVGAYQRQLNVSNLNVVLRTDGKFAVDADGQTLAQVKYHLGELVTIVDLAEKTALQDPARTAVRVYRLLFQDWAWNVLIGSLSVYYGLPVELTIRFTHG